MSKVDPKKKSNPTLRFRSAGLRTLAFGVIENSDQNTFGLSELILDTVDDLSEADAKTEVKGLAEAIDKSVFVRAEWLNSLELLLDWLKKNEKRASFKDITGYLSCVAESQTMAGILPAMKTVLAGFLEDNGFDRAK